MLAKKFRLTRAEVALIKVGGKKISKPYFSAQILQTSLTCSRFGVVVSRKIDNRAVVRNLMRRRIYSALEKNKLVSYDVLFFPKPSMLKLSYAEVGSQVDTFLSEISGVAERS